MRKIAQISNRAFFIGFLTALGALGAPRDTPAAGPTQATPAAPCPDPMAAVKAFYDSNDAGRLDLSLAFLTQDATLASWSEGVNGYHMMEKHLTGKGDIRKTLSNPGLRRTTGRPNEPIYKEAETKISGDRVKFTLRPDRLRPNGKPYHPYQVEVRLEGCKIKALTVIELVTWL